MTIQDTRDQIDRCFTPISNDNTRPAINSDEYATLKRKANDIVHTLSSEIETAIKNAKPSERPALIAYRDSLSEARQDLDHGLVLSINEQWKSKKISDNRKDPDPEPISNPTAYLDKYHSEQYKKWKK